MYYLAFPTRFFSSSDLSVIKSGDLCINKPETLFPLYLVYSQDGNTRYLNSIFDFENEPPFCFENIESARQLFYNNFKNKLVGYILDK